MPEVIINNKIKSEMPKGLSFNNKKLTIEDNIVFEEPLILKIDNEPLEIEVGKSSELKIILEINNDIKDALEYNLVLTLNENSNVTYLLITELDSEDLVINHDFIVKADANLKLLGGFLNNKLKANLTNKLVGEGANAHIRAVIISSTDNDQQIDLEIIHDAKYTYGLMHNIAIAGSNGKVILNGIEKINQGMSKSDAYQTLTGIATSNDAVIEVNPILLIDEYDIAAGHGATVGQLDEISIYYLMSRGLSRNEAEKLMINGLLRPIIDEITEEDIKERFVKVVNDRL